MKILGIETSCDECAAAVVEDGRLILSDIVLSQIPFHAHYQGVVPEIASRKHVEWILPVVREALHTAGLGVADIDGVAATSQPGLSGSLLVGLEFAKAFSWARRVPFIACNHIFAHLYASTLRLPAESGGAEAPAYPFIGLLVSGGHTIICRVDDFDTIDILGTTIDDAVGEAFDKVSKFYGLGYPGGRYIDELAATGDPYAFRFPLPSLHKGDHRYDVSYSGLKTAVVNQLDLFRDKSRDGQPDAVADIAASFQRTAVEILLRALFRVVEDTGISTVVAGGGVAANSYLRARLAERTGIRAVFPPARLCGDNGAMVAGLAFRYVERGLCSPLSTSAAARVAGFKKRYP